MTSYVCVWMILCCSGFQSKLFILVAASAQKKLGFAVLLFVSLLRVARYSIRVVFAERLRKTL